MPETLSAEAYTSAGGLCCPACGGTDLVGRDYDQAGPESVTRAWLCENCGATWRAVYALQGYRGLCAYTKVE